ncbi:MAG TPA: lysophospholipid acyltransferase family protein [Gemmatimonadaceae bacterium]|jgi:1-acyl-sn-glycerol-3-phosphate acyltransferase|nr:lysophospholipid acyltransferase family protein [Gemmatimonadaceae bacterium]
MRTPLFALVAIVMTLLLGPTVIVARLLRMPQGPDSIYARAIRLWARTISRAAGVKVVVHGRERLSGKSGRVYAANHVSWFDIFALASEVPWCSFVAKAELRRIPLFGFAAEAAGIVFLDRENRKQAFASYEVAAKEVQRGRGIIVCPEGTRGHDYHLRPFKKGPFVLAIASQTPVIPTVVYGAREVMPKGSFRVRPGTIELHFLEPVPTIGYDYDHRAELMTETWTRMAEALRAHYGVTTSEHPVASAER